MPKPKKNEKKEDFISRCIPIVMEEGNNKDQAVGKCYGMWGSYKGEKKSFSSSVIEASGLYHADTVTGIRFIVNGYGLLNNNILDYNKLTEDEYFEIEDLFLGLQQPLDVPHGSIFYFTPEGVERHKRLISLLSKIAKGKVRMERKEIDKEDIVWNSDDGQIAVKKSNSGDKMSSRDLVRVKGLVKRAFTEKNSVLSGNKINGVRVAFRSGKFIHLSMKKLASVTFYLPSAKDMDKPLDMLSLGTEIFKFWSRSGRKEWGDPKSYDQITPDGGYHFKFTGTMNFYLYDTPPGIAEEIVNEFTERNSSFFKIMPKGVEPSGSLDTDVYRFEILENRTKDIEEVPEMNVANGSYEIIREILTDLGAGDNLGEYSGEILVSDLEKIIDSISEDRDYIGNYERDESVDQSGGATMYDSGYDLSRLMRYMDGFRKLVEYAKKVGDDRIYAA